MSAPALARFEARWRAALGLPAGWRHLAGPDARGDHRVADERGVELPWPAGWRWLGKNASGHPELAAPDGGTMIWIGPGRFRMGSRDSEAERRLFLARGLFPHPREWFDPTGPEHEVELAGYFIAKHETTRRQFRAFLLAQPAWRPGRPGPAEYLAGWRGAEPPPGTQDHPVTGVTWEAARAYARWAGLELPTEAQWERAARGTDRRLFPWGDDLTDLGRRLNYADRRVAATAVYRQFAASYRADYANRAADDGASETSPVGRYPAGASPCGALDLAGNVWEWCRDAWDPEFYRRAPPGGWRDPLALAAGVGVERVARGGGWPYPLANSRATNRRQVAPGAASFDLGFRTARPAAPR